MIDNVLTTPTDSIMTDNITNSAKYKCVLLSHKDTDVLTLSSAKQMLPIDFPPIETADLCSLKNDSDMLEVITEKILNNKSNDGADDIDAAPQTVILVRLLGRGVPGFQHLLDHVQKDPDWYHLIVVSGIPGSFEPDL